VAAVGRFFGWRFWPQPKVPRGAALVRAGLALYDAYARDPSLGAHTAGPLSAAGAPPVNRGKYRRICSYYDGQVPFPERLVLSMLDDARTISAEQGLDFRVLTYHGARLAGKTVEISPAPGCRAGRSCTMEPSLIINATGAWVDETLGQLQVGSERLMGGTKGSHLFTFNRRLRGMLRDQGIYAEASDLRPIFITPLDRAVLVGTTDVPFEGPPEDATATEAELEYLLASVNAVLPDARLDALDIDFHTSAVRPLPYVHARSTAAITRRHSFVRHATTRVPMFSVVGGKLTTMRSLAEQAAALVFEILGGTVLVNSRERIFPGAEDFPDFDDWERIHRAIAQRTGLPVAAIEEVWKLCGTRCEAILARADDRSLLADTDLPRSFVRWSIEHEHARTLADLVERRLMLLYHQRLTRACLASLAELLAKAGHLEAGQTHSAVAAEVARLKARYGKNVS
jgi:glycerol-3-phosphate dehydrogenase